MEILKTFKPSKNLSPNTLFPIIYNNNNKNKDITIMNWGLQHGQVVINARIETLEETLFKSLLKNNRCCVIIDGFYEFKKVLKDDKDPYFFYFTKNGNEQHNKFEDTIEPMKLACLYEEKNNKLSFTILTCAAGSSIKFCHDRQPVCLNNIDLFHKWLSTSSLDVSSLISELKNDQLNVEFKSHQCINKVRHVSYQQLDANLPLKSSTKPISNYFSKSPSKSTPIKTENDDIKTTIDIVNTQNDNVIDNNNHNHINNNNNNNNNNNSNTNTTITTTTTNNNNNDNTESKIETKGNSFISLLDDDSNEVEIISTPHETNTVDNNNNNNATSADIIASSLSSTPLTSCPLCNISFLNFSSYDIKRHSLFCTGGSGKKRKTETKSNGNSNNKKTKTNNNNNNNNNNGSLLKFLI